MTAVNKLDVRHDTPEDGIHVYSLTGSLFGTTGGYAFVDQIREQAGAGAKGIVVDFAGVDRIDSCGIGIIVSTVWSASQAGRQMILAAIPERIERVLTMAMLLDHIGNAPTVEEALAKIKQETAS